MRARRWLLVLLAAYLLAGPVLKQTFGLRMPRAFQTWRMFTGTARDVCQVEIVGPTRVEVRGRVVRANLPMLRRRLCYQNNGARLRARCGSRDRWVIEDDGTADPCDR